MYDLLETFEIGRSLSMKGCPYDNAVEEATYKVMKIELVSFAFLFQSTFDSNPTLLFVAVLHLLSRTLYTVAWASIVQDESDEYTDKVC
ncbi:hypothetical protein D3C78_1258780 [compost metagenome]